MGGAAMTTLLPTALEAAAKAFQTAYHEHADTLDGYESMLAAAITAYLAQAEKEGWVMVPKDRLAEHAAWLRVYVEESKAENWRDMKLRASQQLDDVDAMLAAAQNGGE